MTNFKQGNHCNHRDIDDETNDGTLHKTDDNDNITENDTHRKRIGREIVNTTIIPTKKRE